MIGLRLISKEDESLVGRESETNRRHLVVELLQLAAIAVDAFLIVAAAILGRSVYSIVFSTGGPSLETMASVSVLVVLLFTYVHWLRGGYTAASFGEPQQQVKGVTVAWIATFFVLGWGAFLFKSSADFSRGAVSAYFVLGWALLALTHALGAHWLGRRFAKADLSLARIALVVAGDGTEVTILRKNLSDRGIDAVSCSVVSTFPQAFGSSCRAAVADVRTALTRSKLDGIYLFLPWNERRLVEELAAAFGPMPIPIYLLADRDIEKLLNKPGVRLGDHHGFELQRPPLTRVDRASKRLLDIFVAALGLAVLSPLLLLTSLAILLETGRPVFFRQKRKGFGAKPFEILKFRSMTVQENGPVVTQATRNDARVTRLGRLLRKTSIDELPQLINVLRGDMSLVGPRPHAIAHDDHYDALIATYAFRQHVKPGITGWAQINGHRGETKELGQMSARVEHDLWYINHWSLLLDIKIMLLTAIRVLMDEGAY